MYLIDKIITIYFFTSWLDKNKRIFKITISIYYILLFTLQNSCKLTFLAKLIKNIFLATITVQN